MMSRIDENQQLIDNTKMSYTGDVAKVQAQIMANQIGILIDISKSLAVIADCCLDNWQHDRKEEGGFCSSCKFEDSEEFVGQCELCKKNNYSRWDPIEEEEDE